MNISKGWRLESSMVTQIRRDYSLQHVIPVFVESELHEYRVKSKMNHQSLPPCCASDLADSSFTASSLILALLSGRGVEKTTANHSKKSMNARMLVPGTQQVSVHLILHGTLLEHLEYFWNVLELLCYFLSV